MKHFNEKDLNFNLPNNKNRHHVTNLADIFIRKKAGFLCTRIQSCFLWCLTNKHTVSLAFYRHGTGKGVATSLTASSVTQRLAFDTAKKPNPRCLPKGELGVKSDIASRSFHTVPFQTL